MNQRLDEEEVYRTIVKFHDQWDVVPSTGFLAGIHKVTIHTIYRKLSVLEEQKKIKLLKKEKYNSGYKLL